MLALVKESAVGNCPACELAFASDSSVSHNEHVMIDRHEKSKGVSADVREHGGHDKAIAGTSGRGRARKNLLAGVDA